MNTSGNFQLSAPLPLSEVNMQKLERQKLDRNHEDEMDNFTSAEDSGKKSTEEQSTRGEEVETDDDEREGTVPDSEQVNEEEPSGQDDSDWNQQQKEEAREKVIQIKDEANQQFNEGLWQQAADNYGQGLQLCPRSMAKDLAILHANRAAALIKLAMVEEAIKDCDKAIQLDENYVRALARRASAREMKDQYEEALEDWKRVLELDSSHAEARRAAHRLPGEINERNEKLKTEMLDKLKQLGNTILRPFNLSTDNFKMTPNEAGGYSVNFQQ